MTNRILDVVVQDHRLDPIATELRIFVRTAQLTPTTQVRGRLHGPHSNYASTIEIAYPMSEIERHDHVVLRVAIPEPNWWHPQTPFLYRGALELVQDGEVCERVPIHHGIRWVQLGSKGLRLNGKPFVVRAKFAAPDADESQLQAWRGAGFNTLLTQVGDAGLELWKAADRLGFLMLGSAERYAPFAQWHHDLVGHASTLGWIFNRTQLADAPTEPSERGLLFGVNTSSVSAVSGADFLVCHERELGWLEGAELPKMVVVPRLPEPLPERADVIGWIESA